MGIRVNASDGSKDYTENDSGSFVDPEVSAKSEVYVLLLNDGVYHTFFGYSTEKIPIRRSAPAAGHKRTRRCQRSVPFNLFEENSIIFLNKHGSNAGNRSSSS